MKLIQRDFDCIGQVAKHCNWSQLCIAIERALTFDLIPLVCYDDWKRISDSYNEIYRVESETDRFNGTFDETFDYTFKTDWKYSNLWNGGEFKGCGGKWHKHEGLKRVWIYFAYAQYVIESAQKDTPTGRKVLDNDFSIPVNYKELQVIEDKYRSMAFEAWEGVKLYLCSIGERKDCKDCGCDDKCDGKARNISSIKSKPVYR